MDQPLVGGGCVGSPGPECLLERVERQVGSQRVRHSPTDDEPGIGVDHQRRVDEARPGGNIGDVGQPQTVRAVRFEAAVDQIGGACSVLSSGMVVRLVSPLTTPFRPSRRMSRSTVQRATPIPSRCSWRHTLRAPYTPKFDSHTRRIWGVAPRPAYTGRSAFGFTLPPLVLVVDRQGDRQLSTNRLDPIGLSVIINEGGHLRGRRSSSACAKYADAFLKISFARRSSRFSRRNSFNSAS